MEGSEPNDGPSGSKPREAAKPERPDENQQQSDEDVSIEVVQLNDGSRPLMVSRGNNTEPTRRSSMKMERTLRIEILTREASSESILDIPKEEEEKPRHIERVVRKEPPQPSTDRSLDLDDTSRMKLFGQKKLSYESDGGSSQTENRLSPDNTEANSTDSFGIQRPEGLVEGCVCLTSSS
ncbi:uncharacterized protein Dvir_GJ25995 [Drosophila virilis]|uniref:Uncharacterized protein n=1 Tax=Drosophila virilis TaxID=7244 RepID=A0A0Q9W396_DROVI|nr:uncharacterized protein Dvir_GJ25995 [Drosophila virilis]